MCKLSSMPITKLNGRPNRQIGTPKNIWIAKQESNGQVKNIFGLPKQIEVLINNHGTPILFFLFRTLPNLGYLDLFLTTY